MWNIFPLIQLRRMKTIEKVASILKLFSFDRTELGLTEISRETGIPKGTTHRILSALNQHGLIEQLEDNKKYKLGVSLFELGRIASQDLELRTVASPVLKKLSEEYNCAAHLAILDELDIIYLDKKANNNFFEFASKIGLRVPAHATALGKILLAYTDLDQLGHKLKGKELKKYTDHTITETSNLLDELKRCRQSGYAIDSEEISQGLMCIAAPVRNYKGVVEAAISLSKPTSQITDQSEEEMIESVVKAANQISYQLGYTQKRSPGGDETVEFTKVQSS